MIVGVGFLALAAQPAAWAADAGQTVPDFKDVYDLIRQNAAGVTDADLNRAAVEGLVRELRSKVTLVTNGVAVGESGAGPLAGKPQVILDDVAYLRIGSVSDDIAGAVDKACRQLNVSNRVKGVVLDLRYAGGGDYAAAAAVVDLFANKAESLYFWGSQTISSHENTNAFKLPVTVLINGETSGAAELLAALFRETGSGLILGSHSAGRAMSTKSFPLSGGAELLIGTGPITLGDGSKMSPSGVKPDIEVPVSPEDERAFYANEYRVVASTNSTDSGVAMGGDAGDTNRSHVRFNEAELVRERTGHAAPGAADQVEDKPVISDPVLARAADLLKGLAVVRKWQS